MASALSHKQVLSWLCLLSLTVSTLEQPICRVHVAYWGWSAQEDLSLCRHSPEREACSRILNKLLEEDLPCVVSSLLVEVGRNTNTLGLQRK